MLNIQAMIARWRAGDESAAERLYTYHRDATFRLAYGILGNREDAEEAAQDALTYALLNIRRYDAQRASFSTWLHMITVSRCRDRQRRKRLPLIALTAWWGLNKAPTMPSAGPEQRVIRGETHNEVWRAVQALNPHLREAIILRYWADHTYREMADILECPLPTAQSRVRLAYKQLRQMLGHKPLESFVEEGVR